ncbi:MAG: 2OG-Fe(II) oxygenase [Alphaproteobacteria bacterium]|nr:2OG-Fe(II) oxygenase [Alphaproteobacteria bacterium]
MTRPELTADIVASLRAAFAAAHRDDLPYRHWYVRNTFPQGVSAAVRNLPFAPPDLGGVSGKRELHNDQRHYFDAENQARFEVCAAVAQAFQSADAASAIARTTGADLDGTFVRLEFAQDTDGFWLEPHTDLGVKRFTMLIYLADDEGQADLGTDMYRAPGEWVKRTPFDDNAALVFVPGDATWHGVEPRPIVGVRRTLIMNYVTDGWRDRSQLSYPEAPVRI